MKPTCSLSGSASSATGKVDQYELLRVLISGSRTMKTGLDENCFMSGIACGRVGSSSEVKNTELRTILFKGEKSETMPLQIDETASGSLLPKSLTKSPALSHKLFSDSPVTDHS